MAQIKKELRELRLVQLKRRENEKYRYYVPIGKMEEFINKIGSGDYFVSLFSAANGVGKSTAMANVLANMFWKSGNKYFNQPIFKNWPFELRAGRVVSDPTSLKETIIPILEEWFPKGRYKQQRRGKTYPYSWRTDTGWNFDLMTYDQDVKEFESANLSFAFFDEPPPLGIFKATVARMRRGGIIVIWATPLTGSAWMYDEIVANPDPDRQYRCFMEAEVEDACITHGVRGFLKHEDILKMIAQYDDEDMQARVFGKFQHLVGLVFKKWNRDIHLIDPFEIDPHEFVVSQVYDTHPRVNEAIMWVAYDRKGRAIIIDEIWDNMPTEHLVALIKQKDEKYHTKKWILDASAFTTDTRIAGVSYADLLRQKYGLAYQPGSKRRADAIRLIRDRLSYTVSGGEFIRTPTTFVFSTCPRTIWEVEHYQWDDWRGKTAEYKDPKPTPQDKDDHMIENWGRALLDPPVFAVEEPVSAYRSAVKTEVNDDPFS